MSVPVDAYIGCRHSEGGNENWIDRQPTVSVQDEFGIHISGTKKVSHLMGGTLVTKTTSTAVECVCRRNTTHTRAKHISPGNTENEIAFSNILFYISLLN